MERKERDTMCASKRVRILTDQLFVTLYIYLSLGKPTAAPISPEPFSTHPLYMERNYITKTKLYFNYTNPQDGSQNVVRL